MLDNKIIQIILGICFVLCLTVENNWAQKDKSIDNCEIMSSKLNEALLIFSKEKLERSYLIIIGEASKRENPKYNKTRVFQTIKYFKTRGIKEEEIIYGLGPGSKDVGLIRIYINGIKFVEIKVGVNGGVCYEVDNPNKPNKPKM